MTFMIFLVYKKYSFLPKEPYLERLIIFGFIYINAEYYRNSFVTICPKSSYPFYIVTYYFLDRQFLFTISIFWQDDCHNFCHQINKKKGKLSVKQY